LEPSGNQEGDAIVRKEDVKCPTNFERYLCYHFGDHKSKWQDPFMPILELFCSMLPKEHQRYRGRKITKAPFPHHFC